MVAMPNLCIEGDMCSSAFLQKHLHIQSCRTRKYSGFRFECPFALEQKGARFSQSALLLIPWDGIWNGFFAAKGLSRDVHSNVTHPDKHGIWFAPLAPIATAYGRRCPACATACNSAGDRAKHTLARRGVCLWAKSFVRFNKSLLSGACPKVRMEL